MDWPEGTSARDLIEELCPALSSSVFLHFQPISSWPPEGQIFAVLCSERVPRSAISGFGCFGLCQHTPALCCTFCQYQEPTSHGHVFEEHDHLRLITELGVEYRRREQTPSRQDDRDWHHIRASQNHNAAGDFQSCSRPDEDSRNMICFHVCLCRLY